MGPRLEQSGGAPEGWHPVRGLLAGAFVKKRLPTYLAVGAPPRSAAMLLDRQRHLMDLDLPDDARRGGGGLEAVSAGGAEVQEIVLRSPVDLFRWEQDPFVFGVSGLSADLAPVLARWRWRLGRLDDV